jgi:Protein of unknown function (DUF3301)
VTKRRDRLADDDDRVGAANGRKQPPKRHMDDHGDDLTLVHHGNPAVRRTVGSPSMWELVLLAAAGLAGWLVFDTLRAREAAVAVAKAACQQQRVQFLDDTVRGLRTRFDRDGEGHAVLRRIFVFEFSEDGVGRRAGSVTMLGAQVESVQLEPGLTA